MVDVGEKPVTAREARARALLRVPADVRDRLFDGDLPKGEALGTARIAGIQAGKITEHLIPLCHSVPMDALHVDFERVEEGVEVRTVARCTARTGVEMEALTAASVAALTLYDMCKAICRDATIDAVQLTGKTGGSRGDWFRPGYGPGGEAAR